MSVKVRTRAQRSGLYWGRTSGVQLQLSVDRRYSLPKFEQEKGKARGFEGTRKEGAMSDPIRSGPSVNPKLHLHNGPLFVPQTAQRKKTMFLLTSTFPMTPRRRQSAPITPWAFYNVNQCSCSRPTNEIAVLSRLNWFIW